MFPPGVPIDEEAGRRVAAWAAGGSAKVEPEKVDLTAMLEAFAKIGCGQDVVEHHIGKPLLQWSTAEVKAARSLYHSLTAKKAATI